MRRSLAALFLLAAFALPAAAEEPLLVVPAGTPEQVVFDWDRDRCAKTDIPDAPPRAFRDASGRVHLMASHQDNRQFVGPDFDHLGHPCTVIYQGAQSADPAAFDDRQWLAAFQTDDGRTIHALVHNEFQGNTHPGLCPSHKYLSCWYNSITYAVSTDGGATFRAPPSPANVVAAPPVPYDGDAGKPVGYFQPTNIVRGRDGAFYFMFLSNGIPGRPGGVCVARSPSPDRPGSWRAWDGSGFNARLSGAYDRDLSPGACTGVGRGSLFELGSLAYDRTSGLFVYLGAISIGKGDKAHPPGAYYATSPDLVTWSRPVRLFTSPKDPKTRYGLFALIDEASGTRDFSEISGYGDLYLYYVKFDLTRQPYARVMVKAKVSLAAH
ncbi:MAG: hypothetical protein J0H94_01705 [Rhizobiales bacterium]|nr:hypothetical protein [Hyphomicrobiales bacterium]